MAIDLVVVTPEGEALSQTVEQVVLPGEAGEFGVLESHERFLTPLLPGAMEIKESGGSKWAAISSGFAEVDGSRIVVLVDACALASDLDPAEVEAEKAEAEKAIYDLEDNEQNAGEIARLQALVARKQVELDVAGR